jgi:hypothetical protein
MWIRMTDGDRFPHRLPIRGEVMEAQQAVGSKEPARARAGLACGALPAVAVMISVSTCREAPDKGSGPRVITVAQSGSADAQGNPYLDEAFNPRPQQYICSNGLRTSVQGEFPPDRPEGQGDAPGNGQ